MRGIPLLAENRTASQEGLFSMEQGSVNWTMTTNVVFLPVQVKDF
jgi:hypothetical protein